VWIICSFLISLRNDFIYLDKESLEGGISLTSFCELNGTSRMAFLCNFFDLALSLKSIGIHVNIFKKHTQLN
jgi:hypothetical protein